MDVIFVFLIIILAIMYMLFMMLLPSIFNIAICYASFRALKFFGIRMAANLAIVLTISFLLGFNIRTISIFQEIFSNQKEIIYRGKPITINQNSSIKITSNFDEIRFKENIFDSVSYHCNEGTGCSYRKPKAIKENIKENVLNSGLKISNEQENSIHLEIFESTNAGVAIYNLRLSNNNGVIAQEKHRRRILLTGEEYIYYPYKSDFGGFKKYIFSNTFWDLALRGVFNKKQEAFLEEFLEKTITVQSREKITTKFSSILEESNENLKEQYYIKNYPNIYHPIGCEDKNIERSILVKNNTKHTTITLLSHPEPIKIIEEYNNLDKIICRSEGLYFVYISRIHPDILVSEYDYYGNSIANNKISAPALNWSGSPRVSYFEKKEDGSYLIQIKEYLGKEKESKNEILLSALKI